MLLGSALFLVVLIILILKTFVVVPHQHAFIKERLGKYSGTLGPGFHFLVPIVDRVAYKHIVKEEVLDVPAQVCITKDNVQVEVDGILYLRVLDPERASYGINNYRFASSQLSQTSMRSEIGKLDLDHTFRERVTINDSVIKSVDEASDPWGIKVTRYEIKNINPPHSVLLSMEQQMKAERDKRADIFHSEGTRQSTINASNADKQEAINISEGEKQKRINEAEGVASQIERVATATAQALREVSEAIQKPGGADAVQLRIAQEFVKQFGDVVDSTTPSVLPLGPATIQSTFEGLSGLMKGFNKGEE